MRVAVAMSGGMDSTAAALMLKREGHEVLGLHMLLHSDSRSSWERARQSAAEVGVEIIRIDLKREFDLTVVSPFVDEYARGRTPSPCPLCNRFIKMTKLWDEAASLGCERLATGHYARIIAEPEGPVLLTGVDKRKDQAYFLFMLTGEILERTVFPLGGFTKARVREFLKKEGVSAWESDESQELCFVPGNDYRAFIAGRGVRGEPGLILDLRGKVLGEHSGITGFTVGQRRGLGICGPVPLYVVRIDALTRAVYVGTREETYVVQVKTGGMNWLVPHPPRPGDRFLVKVRSTSKAVGCTLTAIIGDSADLVFDRPESGVAPGQAAVLHSGDRVVGGGWIRETIRQDGVEVPSDPILRGEG
jgi:tRNA-uridine 2-sulfurtransferase